MSAEFKPGDRVKVAEFEAQFEAISDNFRDWAWIRSTEGTLTARVPLSLLSKLPDPEPEWRKGDVVRFQEWQQGPFHVALRTGGRWQCSCGVDFRDEDLYSRWREGRVTVLHREDQP